MAHHKLKILKAGSRHNEMINYGQPFNVHVISTAAFIIINIESLIMNAMEVNGTIKINPKKKNRMSTYEIEKYKKKKKSKSKA